MGCMVLIDQAIQRPGGLLMRAVFNTPDKFHYIAATAVSKAMPQPPGQVNPEGGGVVAPMKGAWAVEGIIFLFETAVKTIGGKHLMDVDSGFEPFEIK